MAEAFIAPQHPLVKQPSEDLSFTMDFANILESGETISSVVSVTKSITRGTGDTLAIGSSSYTGSTVSFRLTAGASGEEYRISVKVTTSLSNTREGDGRLKIKD